MALEASQPNKNTETIMALNQCALLVEEISRTWKEAKKWQTLLELMSKDDHPKFTQIRGQLLEALQKSLDDAHNTQERLRAEFQEIKTRLIALGFGHMAEQAESSLSVLK